MRKLLVLFVALAAMMGCRNDAAAVQTALSPGQENFRTAVRAFYLWRCGTEVDGGHTPTDWVDDQDDYSRNEIAINWQGALVYLLAAVLE